MGSCATRRAELRTGRDRLLRQLRRLRKLQAAVRVQTQRSRALQVRLEDQFARIRARLLRPERPFTILVVDDEPAVRDSLRLLLEDLGARVLTARDGEEGLALAEAARPHVVLTDLRMPRLDGWELLKRLRRSARLGSTPVIAMSAYVTDQETERLRAAGFDGCLAKPFHPDELVTVLRTVRRSA